ncbi:hypothetical protein BKA66DRAFT_55223 [Pyrenochaeta sp. MPI-SDFR-AT-0127]|nr:hypothetical protein BKA66DRAFT_55223 [Pyrenochaeta sp. MPI-SDFR-AT-0127]
MNLNAPVWPHQPSRSTFPQALPSQHLQILNPESQIQQQLEQTKFQSMPQRNQIRPHIPQPADISAGIRFHKPAKRAEASVLPLSEALGAGLLEDYKELKHLEAIILRQVYYLYQRNSPKSEAPCHFSIITYLIPASSSVLSEGNPRIVGTEGIVAALIVQHGDEIKWKALQKKREMAQMVQMRGM